MERPRRSVKYEEVYIKDPESVMELGSGPSSYFRSYNEERPHQSLNYQTPAEVHGV